jgi:gamma-glutamylcyclotransferase (GGCT)/AIG2-like uncharacterized protein YtfP
MTKQEDGSVLYAVYGTLRKGHGNYRWCLQGKSEFLGEIKTPAQFTMVGKGAGFPYVLPLGDTPIVVEIYRVTDKQVIQSINSLEGYTGQRGHSSNWYNTCDVDTPWGLANMFINESIKNPDPSRIIETGDWNNQK